MKKFYIKPQLQRLGLLRLITKQSPGDCDDDGEEEFCDP